MLSAPQNLSHVACSISNVINKAVFVFDGSINHNSICCRKDNYTIWARIWFTHAHKYRALQKDWAGYTLSDFTENFEKIGGKFLFISDFLSRYFVFFINITIYLCCFQDIFMKISATMYLTKTLRRNNINFRNLIIFKVQILYQYFDVITKTP